MRVMVTRVAVRFRTGSPGRDWSGFMREPIAGVAPSACATALTGDLNALRDHLAITPDDVSAATVQVRRKCKIASTRQRSSIGLQNAKALALNLSERRAFMVNSRAVIPTIAVGYSGDQQPR